MSRVEPLRVRMRKLGADLVEVKFGGFIGEADHGYLRNVAALLAEQPGLDTPLLFWSYLSVVKVYRL